VLAVICLSACSWFGHKKPAWAATELIVTGAPLGSSLAVDGKTVGQPVTQLDHAQVVRVAPGSHTVEIHAGDAVVYHEETDVSRGKRQVVTVLSGNSR
jgi:hypothetical protein